MGQQWSRCVSISSHPSYPCLLRTLQAVPATSSLLDGRTPPSDSPLLLFSPIRSLHPRNRTKLFTSALASRRPAATSTLSSHFSLYPVFILRCNTSVVLPLLRRSLFSLAKASSLRLYAEFGSLGRAIVSRWSSLLADVVPSSGSIRSLSPHFALVLLHAGEASVRGSSVTEAGRDGEGKKGVLYRAACCQVLRLRR